MPLLPKPWLVEPLTSFRRKQKEVREFVDGSKFFMHLPEDLRVGPWRWAPTLFWGWAVTTVLALAPAGFRAFEPMPLQEPRWAGAVRLGCCIYGVAVSSFMLRRIGSWPMISWTMMGWNIATLRYFCGFCGLRRLQRALTFPSVMANLVTFVVWYVALMPGIVLMTKKERRWNTILWMLSPLMLNIHGLNLPFSLLDFWLQPVSLTLFDLWAGAAYAIFYLSFYLLVLDPMGVHFYFILAPRKWWAVCSYCGILMMIVASWRLFGGRWWPDAP